MSDNERAKQITNAIAQRFSYLDNGHIKADIEKEILYGLQAQRRDIEKGIPMNEYDVKRLALALAIQAEIEGMKARNRHCKMIGSGITYYEDSFQAKAEELRTIAAKHNEQL